MKQSIINLCRDAQQYYEQFLLTAYKEVKLNDKVGLLLLLALANMESYISSIKEVVSADIKEDI